MKAYTLKELSLIFESKHYLSKDRFLYYFTNRFGFSEQDAKEMYRMYIDFPRKVFDEKNHSILEIILNHCIELLEEIQTGTRIPFVMDRDKEYKKLVYMEDGEMKEFIFDIFDTSAIITYAEIIKRKVDILCLLSLCTKIYKDSKDTFVFEGDLYNTNDTFYGDKSTVCLAEENDAFVKLFYTKGKGYMINNKLNIDEDRRYNSHCLTLYDYSYMGNIHIDTSILMDTKTKKA